MVIPIIGLAPSNPEERRRIIGSSSSEKLEGISEHVQGMMFALRQTPENEDYAIWSDFLTEIKAEQRKRDENSN